MAQRKRLADLDFADNIALVDKMADYVSKLTTVVNEKSTKTQLPTTLAFWSTVGIQKVIMGYTPLRIKDFGSEQ